ncbi:hypothetical protein BDR26DRAFT_886846 [Obelidium mucronatum]|nr:hypothetical protein BDR26DRAFT_886846 [Obelidium mucronatum]
MHIRPTRIRSAVLKAAVVSAVGYCLLVMGKLIGEGRNNQFTARNTLWNEFAVEYYYSDSQPMLRSKWQGTVECWSSDICTFTNLFSINKSFHVFLVDPTIDHCSTTYIELNLGKPPESILVSVHTNLEPKATVLDTANIIDQHSSILSLDQCHSFSDQLKVLAAHLFSRPSKTRLVTLESSPDSLLDIMNSFSTERVRSISELMHPGNVILFNTVYLGINASFWEEFQKPTWNNGFLSFYATFTETIRNSIHSKEVNHFESGERAFCLLGHEHSLFSTDLSESLQLRNLKVVEFKKLSFNSSILFGNCETVLCKAFDCQDLIYLVQPGTRIIATASPGETTLQENKNLLLRLNLKFLIISIETGHNLTANRLESFLSSAAKIESKSTKFLLFMPWEQLNNQLIGLKTTCAMAKLLDRTLVLPLLGQRQVLKTPSKEWDFSFNISELSWGPISRYFDSSILETSLPCSAISQENFKTLVENEKGIVTVDHAVFNPVAKATSPEQLQEYFNGVLGYRLPTIDTKYSRMSQLSDHQVVENWGTDPARILAFGAAFWMYGFNRSQPYPLTKYENYMSNVVYAQTVKALEISPRLKLMVKEKLLQVQQVYGKNLIALHIRRGDYWNKCKRIQNLILQKKCYPSDEEIRRNIVETIEAQKKSNPSFKPVIYIATNIGGFRKEMEPIRSIVNTILYFEDVFQAPDQDFANDSHELVLDSIDKALLDIEFCSKAEHFLGNFYSSFSRAIFEKRELNGLQYATF